MPWYPSAKACPAAIKPTVQCFFPTLYQVLLFNFSSFGEKLFFCLRGYAAQSREARCKNSRSAERGCSSVHPPPNRRRMGGGNNPAPPPTGYAAQSREARCKNSRSAERGCSSVHPPPNRRRMGGGSNLALALGGEGLTLPYCQQPIAAPGNPLTHNHATPHQKEGQPC